MNALVISHLHYPAKLSSSLTSNLKILLEKLSRTCSRLRSLPSHVAFFILKNCFYIPKLMYILRTSTLFLKTTSLHRFDECIRNTLQAIFNVMIDDPRWELMTLPCLVLLIILSNLLLCCGDIKPNPRPIVQFNDISEKLNSYGNKIKSTLKLQEFKQKRSNLQKLVNTCGLNTIYGVSGTWFNDSKEKNLRTL